jgi:peptide/nickel transport system permease protein
LRFRAALRGDAQIYIALGLLMPLLLLAALAPAAGPASLRYPIVADPFLTPFSTELIWGTDHIGRDFWVGCADAARVMLLRVVPAAALAVSVGVAVGLTAALSPHGAGMRLLNGLTSTLLILPALLVAMLASFYLGDSEPGFILTITLVAWPGIAKMVGAEVVRLSGQLYVLAARSLGGSLPHILCRHILPGLTATIAANACTTLSFVVALEASMSFIGLGSGDRISLGGLIGANRRFLLDSWWMVGLPGGLLVLWVTGSNLLATRLTGLLDARAVVYRL